MTLRYETPGLFILRSVTKCEVRDRIDLSATTSLVYYHSSIFLNVLAGYYVSYDNDLPKVQKCISNRVRRPPLGAHKTNLVTTFLIRI